MLFKLTESVFIAGSYLKAGSVVRISLTLDEWVTKRYHQSLDKSFAILERGYGNLVTLMNARKDQKIKASEVKSELDKAKKLIINTFHDKVLTPLEDWGTNRDHEIVKQVKDAYTEINKSFEVITEALTAEVIKGDVDDFYDDIETEVESIDLMVSTIIDKVDAMDK